MKFKFRPKIKWIIFKICEILTQIFGQSLDIFEMILNYRIFQLWMILFRRCSFWSCAQFVWEKFIWMCVCLWICLFEFSIILKFYEFTISLVGWPRDIRNKFAWQFQFKQFTSRVCALCVLHKRSQHFSRRIFIGKTKNRFVKHFYFSVGTFATKKAHTNFR